MHIFQELQKYGQRKTEHKNYFDCFELTEQEQKLLEEKKPPINTNEKQSLCQYIISSLYCLGQIVVIIIIASLLLLIGGYLTRNCDSYLDSDHIHFERFHQ